MPPVTYPPGAPTISGNLLTVDLFLKNPTQIRRVLDNLSSQRFIADNAFASGQAVGGAVIYDQVSEQDLYTDRDIEEIAAGAEFPDVGATNPTPQVAKVAKRGGRFKVTDEQVRRNNMDVVRRNMRKLTNTIIRKHDAIAIAALLAAPTRTGSAEVEWNATSGTDPFADIAGAVSSVEQSDLGYVIDMAIINPQERLSLLTNKVIRESLPRESKSDNPVLSGQLAGLAGIEKWVVSNRCPAGTAIFLNSGVVGTMSDELGMYVNVIPQPLNEVTVVQAARVSVPVITDPKAAFVMTGCFDD